MSDPVVEMFVEFDEDFVVEVSDENHDATMTAEPGIWPFKSGVCLLCAGSKGTAKDKLHSLTPDGLQTIRRSCETKGKTDLLSYLDANPTVKHVIHNSCRTLFNKVRPEVSRSTSGAVEGPPCKRTLRSQNLAFRWKEMCFLCGEAMDSDTNDQRKVATFAVGIRLMETCFMRSYDQWAMEIKGRLESCIDLPAEEAVYHRACYARFLNGRGRVAGEIPSGRPVNVVAQTAFEQLCEHLETMCASEKMYTLDDLRLLMLSWGYNEEDVYGSKSIKNKLKARYGEHMFFAEVRGRKKTAMLMQKLMPQLNAEENQMPAVKLQDESVIDNLRLSEEQVSSLHKLYNDVLLRKVNVVDEAVQEGNDVNEEQLTSHVLQNNNSLLTLDTNLQLLCTLLAEQSRTAKLWIEYLKHIDILRSFIVAERTSNWEKHLSALSCMLPLFASQHHVNYAKSGFVYLQNMHDLEQKSPWLYQQFMNGLHSVRKSDRYWAGLSTDLVIEQDMMRQVKSKGGLTRSRGLEESTRTVWLNTVTECARIISTLAELSGTKRTADEHIEMTTPRIKRDADAMVKLTAFFQSYSPFQYQDTERLVGLSSGVCAGAHDNVTCDVANAVGLRIIQQWEGLMYPELTV
jgi:hypothetical protein